MAVFMEYHQVPVNAERFPGHIKKIVQWVQSVLMVKYDDKLNIMLGHSSNAALPHCLDIRTTNSRNIVIGFTVHGFLTGWGVYDGSCVERYNPLEAYMRGLNIKHGDIEDCCKSVIKELDSWVRDQAIGVRPR